MAVSYQDVGSLTCGGGETVTSGCCEGTRCCRGFWLVWFQFDCKYRCDMRGNWSSRILFCGFPWVCLFKTHFGGYGVYDVRYLDFLTIDRITDFSNN